MTMTRYEYEQSCFLAFLAPLLLDNRYGVSGDDDDDNDDDDDDVDDNDDVYNDDHEVLQQD